MSFLSSSTMNFGFGEEEYNNTGNDEYYEKIDEEMDDQIDQEEDVEQQIDQEEIDYNNTFIENNGEHNGEYDDKNEDNNSDKENDERSISSESSSQPEENDNEDLDKIWNMVETKLRTPFSSLELCKTIDHLSSPKEKIKFLNAIKITFPRMAKQIQLRFLVSLLGIYGTSDGSDTGRMKKDKRRINTFIYNFLHDLIQQEENQQQHDEWIKHLAGIIMNKLYPKGDSETMNVSEAKLKKTADGICKQLYKYTDTLANQEEEEEAEGSDEENGNVYNKKITTRSYIYEDRAMQYIPFRYKLVSSNIIKDATNNALAIPECDDILHFELKENASILQMDSMLEKKKVDEEVRLFDSNKLIATTNSTVNGSSSVRQEGKGNSHNAVSGVTTTTSSSSNTTTVTSLPNPTTKLKGTNSKSGSSSLFYRPKNNPLTNRNRPMFVNRTTAANRLGETGKGRANTLINKRRTIQASKRTLSSSKSRGISSGKMKMMDDNNDDSDEDNNQSDDDDAFHNAINNNDFSQEHEQDREDTSFFDAPAGRTPQRSLNTPKTNTTATGANTNSLLQAKNAKKRKMLAAAMASNLKNKKMSTMTTNRGIMTSTTKPQLNANKPNLTPTKNNTPLHSFTDQPQQKTEQPNKQQNELLTTMNQILNSDNNKLTNDDKIRIQKFFTTKENPTPDLPTYKMKLHEEKKMDGGNSFKETLYLELDYRTMGFKKTKKTKKY